jgi:hypothetical protein
MGFSNGEIEAFGGLDLSNIYREWEISQAYIHNESYASPAPFFSPE